MKLTKLLLTISLTIFISAFLMNTCFAVSSEKIAESKIYRSDTFSAKIVTIKEINIWDYEKNLDKRYYRITINKTYQKKYKINSVSIKYSDDEGKNPFIKNYSGKNQKTIFIKNPDSVFLDKMTIKYNTPSKIKKQSFTDGYISFDPKMKLVTLFNGKKAKVTQYYSDDSYYKLKITSKKYKIKSIKGICERSGATMFSKTFKGYGKNKLTIKLNHDYANFNFIKITYY